MYYPCQFTICTSCYSVSAGKVFTRCFVLLLNQYEILTIRGPGSSLALVPFSNQCGIPTKSIPLRAQHPYWHTTLCLPHLRETATSVALTHCSMSGFDTICNAPDPLLADIVLLGFSYGLPLKVFRTRLLGKVLYTLIKGVLFSQKKKKKKKKKDKVNQVDSSNRIN